MGRQSHVARLALGRSPFGPPLEDEQGDFLFGPNVQHDTDRDYAQLFDDRGHPRNLASHASRRRLIGAQNDVLATVGVVVRKARKDVPQWQTMNDEQKYRLFLDENTTGAYCGIAESVLQKLSTQWILNFRRRLLCFKSYLGLPIPELILSEWNSLGPASFLFAGFPSATIATTSKLLRDNVLDGDRVPQITRGQSLFNRSSILRTVRTQSLQLLWFAAEYPFYACSVLQALNLCGLGTGATVRALVPFTRDSLVDAAAKMPDWSLPSLISLATHLMENPFVVAFVRDRLATYYFKKIYVRVRQFVVKPDRPDRISLHSTGESLNIDTDHTNADTQLRDKSADHDLIPRSLHEAIQTIFPTLLWLWGRILHVQTVPLAVELSSDMEEELLRRSYKHYRDLVREDEQVDPRRRRDLRTLRVLAIRWAFHDFNLDPDTSMVDIFELADEMTFSTPSRASTSTPEPQEFPPPTTFGPEVETGLPAEFQSDAGSEPPPLQPMPTLDPPGAGYTGLNDASDELEGHAPQPPVTQTVTEQESFSQPAVPLQMLLEPASFNEEAPPAGHPDDARPAEPGPGSPLIRASVPSSPILGIARAASLPNAPPRPVRRPTDLDQDLRPARGDISLPRRDNRASTDADETLYRVTILSNHSADTFANNVTSIIETILLLPLDVLFLRSLANGYLNYFSDSQKEQMAAPGPGSLWRLGYGFDMREIRTSERLQLWGNFFITMGIQGLVNFIIWEASTQVSVALGRKFGWGSL